MTNPVRFLSGTLMASSLLATGCAQVDSEDLKTSGMYANIRVKAKDTTTAEVGVDLTAGSGGAASKVNLTQGDTLTAVAGGQNQTLSQTYTVKLVNDLHYRTAFDFDGSGEAFTIALQRDAGQSAPDSTVTLPAAFSITAPTEGASLSAGDTLTVTWDPPQQDRTLMLTVVATCATSDGPRPVFLHADDAPDDGIENIAVDELINQATDNGRRRLTGPCDGKLRLQRSNIGTLDPHFGGGTIAALQVRTRGFTIAAP